MADQEQVNNNTPQPDADDTQTRKTVSLKPPVIPGALKLPPRTQVAAQQVADPLAGRDTDTGNLEVLDDTQTRRTVKLRPLSPPGGAPAIRLGGPVPEATNTRKSLVLKPGTPASPGEVPTNTRKTVLLKPAGPDDLPEAGSTNTRKTVVLKPVGHAVIPADGGETNTRKTLVLKSAEGAGLKLPQPPTLKPMAAPQESKPAADAAADGGSSDRTVKIQRPHISVPTPSAAPAATKAPVMPVSPDVPVGGGDDRTVKIQRPQPVAVPKAAEEATRQTMVLPENDESARQTMVLPENDESARQTMVLPENDESARQTMVLPEAEADTPTVAVKVVEGKNNSGNATVSLDPALLAGGKPSASAADTMNIEAPPPKEEIPAELPEKSSGETGAEVPAEEKSDGAAETAAAEEAVPVPDEEPVSDEEPVIIPDDGEPESSTGTLVCTIAAALALLIISYAAAVSAVQYLNLWGGKTIDLPIPGLSARR